MKIFDYTINQDKFIAYYYILKYRMRNTTMLKHILQLYTLAIDIDDEDNFYVTMISKKNHASHIIIDKAYSSAIGKAFRYMMKEIRAKEQAGN